MKLDNVSVSRKNFNKLAELASCLTVKHAEDILHNYNLQKKILWNKYKELGTAPYIICFTLSYLGITSLIFKDKNSSFIQNYTMFYL